ncbi:UbiA family prenyltransferase [Subtercola boreus]|uniref:1,4-dihydroxy-2-naphthoate prenyltransferase n=1 Tax=Subtercola boreus TaxID=120213 RepID=A0A3E0WBG1_9MICO|nr:UbiA family prenyltransferase [Subtercola boreus]RFA21866.1 1,4-dihydroxy-2-naphthoate prenyltransferase [Subtercola boreus]RFA21977.1 1,4-dihydroxy-2-naphthoate prenyltransferase [Subtercola boreus]RFA27845.1 1,4-dihydroxy-2-naphthoate prenyltransferase [Subtercola boreus]
MSNPPDDATRDDAQGHFPVPGGRVRALIGASHPGPTVAVTALSVILGFATGLSAPWVLAVGVAILAGQLAIGWSNDWIDARRDSEIGRSDKPIAAGEISAAAVRNAFIVVALLTIPLSFVLGVSAAIAHLVLVVSGVAYNLGIKKTAYSWLPYMLSFGLLPQVVTLAGQPPAEAAWWVIATGSLLGLAAHFANVLPDLDADRQTGIRGLPHRLGRIPSGIAAFVALLLASLAILIGAGPSLLTITGMVLGVLVAALGVRLVLTRPPGRVLFQLIIASALIDVVLLALPGSQLKV